MFSGFRCLDDREFLFLLTLCIMLCYIIILSLRGQEEARIFLFFTFLCIVVRRHLFLGFKRHLWAFKIVFFLMWGVFLINITTPKGRRWSKYLLLFLRAAFFSLLVMLLVLLF